MDPTTQHPPATPSSSRKRARENETPSQRHKREKAAERQRRKRERDRQAAGLQQSIVALSQHQQQQQQHQQPQHVVPPPAAPDVAHNHGPSGPVPVSVSAPPGGLPIPTAPPPQTPSAPPLPAPTPGEELSAEEIAKRDRIRAAARERQRKHRALVKARKLRELGLDMGNEILPGMDDVQYRVDAEGQYTPVLPHEMAPHPHAHPHAHPHPHHNGAHAPPPPPPHAHPHPHGHAPPPPHAMHEPPFPQGQPLGGQTFASTLLLSFSCAPLLKQHLLRTLSMTNEELASLEPIIAQAWDHWDQQVRRRC